MRTYAIGDIHGHLDKLIALHALIAQDMDRHGPAPIVHVGDLVDRGPDCRGVIDYLSGGIQTGADWVVLKGNHDRMFTGFLTDPKWQDPCLRSDLSYLHPKIGGAATLASYGVANPGDRPIAPVHAEALPAVPATHRAFLHNLPTWHQRGEVVFVHAGIKPGVPLPDQTEDDLIWIRKPFLEHTAPHGALIIHGHTAIDRPTHYGNRVNIDSSVAYGGPLSAIVVEGTDVWQITTTGRVALPPPR